MLSRKRRNALAASARKGHRVRLSVELLESRALLATFIPFGGHYYAATDGLLTWQQAENQAVMLGGHLAAITSQAEQNFLTTNFAVHEDIWIGLSDQITKGQYSWTTGEPVTYLAFYPGEPNGVGHAEDFEHMNLTSGLWDDVPGDFHYRGIIELNPTPKISSALLGDTLQVAGSMSGPPGQNFVIDFYAETAESGEGRSHLASTTVTTGADGSASFDLPLPVPNFPAPFVTATATDSSGNTSEFAKALLATRPIVTPPVVLPPVVEPPVVQPPIVTPPVVTPPLPVVQLPVTQPSMIQPPINTGNRFSIELSFATNAAGGYVIEYDPTKSITGPGNSKNYLHVKVKFDVLSPKRPNAGQTLHVDLYWATDTDTIIGFAAHLSMQFDRVSFTTGDTLDFYRDNSYRSFVASKPPEATRLVGIIDPGGAYKNYETNRENNTRSAPIGSNPVAATADEIQLQTVGQTLINPTNNYSEDTKVLIKVVHPKGHPLDGLKDNKFSGLVTITELPGTNYYNGLNGASTLPMSVRVTNGEAMVVLRSVSESNSVDGPASAKIKVTSTSRTAIPQAATNPLPVVQWVDNNSNGVTDWLEKHVYKIMKDAVRYGGEVGTVVRTVTGIVQYNGATPGGTGLGTSVIGINPANTIFGSVRLNNSILSQVVLHEARHAWQNAEAARNHIVHDRERDATEFGRKYGHLFK